MQSFLGGLVLPPPTRGGEEVIRVPLKTTAPEVIIAGTHDKNTYVNTNNKYLYFAFKETCCEPGISLVVRVRK